MIYISLFLLALLLIIYFSKLNLSKGILTPIYVFYVANMFYELFKKNITGSTDYIAYSVAFGDISFSSFKYILNVPVFEPLFRIMAWILLHITPNSTFVIFVLMINIIIVIGLYRFFEDKNLAIFALVFYSYSPMFLGMSTNIIRQMLVISLILLMFNIQGWKKIWLFILPFIHTSSILVVLIFIVNKYLKVKYAIAIFSVTVLLFLSNLNQKLFGSLSLFSEYTSVQTYRAYGGSGNRIDFLVFTILIISFGYFLYKYKLISSTFVKYLLLSGSVFALLGFQAFSERIAIYNWFFLIVLVPYIFPLIKRRIQF